MAAIAVPVIEGATVALLRALGVMAATGAGAVIVDDYAKKKADAAEKARASPIAKAGATRQTRDSCKTCPPDCGTLVERDWNMSDESRAYQARITGFAPATQWAFAGNDFDGFKSSVCMLLEAKARYDQFFDSSGKPKPFFHLTGRSKILSQAKTQSDVVMASPPTSLHWHFMQPLSYKYFTNAFKLSVYPINTHLTP